MLIADLANAGAGPALENLVRFAGERQRLIVHNIANMTTPDFRPVDASVPDFQRNLGDAIAKRRGRTGGETGDLTLSRTQEIRPRRDGSFEIVPSTPSSGVLLHDRNNRDPERLMQALAENVSTFRIATDLLKNRNDLLRTAISQRV